MLASETAERFKMIFYRSISIKCYTISVFSHVFCAAYDLAFHCDFLHIYQTHSSNSNLASYIKKPSLTALLSSSLVGKQKRSKAKQNCKEDISCLTSTHSTLVNFLKGLHWMTLKIPFYPSSCFLLIRYHWKLSWLKKMLFYILKTLFFLYSQQ